MLGSLEVRELFQRVGEIEARDVNPADVFMVLRRKSIYYAWERARTPSHVFCVNLNRGDVHCLDCHAHIKRLTGNLKVGK